MSRGGPRRLAARGYNARWYDSETGRFISEDPATAEPENPLSVNRYIYCLNNPLIYTDQTGLKHDGWAIFAIVALSIVTGGIAGAALAGAIGGAAGAAIGVLAGAVVGNYVGGFASASMSGASFSEAKRRTLGRYK
jgi:RHS repeat-associated protein